MEPSGVRTVILKILFALTCIISIVIFIFPFFDVDV